MFPGLMFKPGPAGGLPFMGKRFQPPKIYGRLGSLEVRLARKKSEIRRAQRLRYKVFYEEMSAVPGALAMLSRRDEDAYDPIFDHLPRRSTTAAPPAAAAGAAPRVVGTYRVLRQDVAEPQ